MEGRQGIDLKKKTELLSMRFTHRGKLALDFLARIERKSMTQVAENLCVDEAMKKGFQDYYDANDGVMFLKLILVKSFHVTDKEVGIEEFVSAHRVFFYSENKKGRLEPNYQFVAVLWPHIETLVSHWQRRKELDAYATGERMQDLLRDAKIKPPAWGNHAK